MADLALRVSKLGRTSVTYEAAVFEQGVENVKAVGKFVHVIVDRNTGSPAAAGMDEAVKYGLEKVLSREATKL